jgi:hypothetical protein
MSRDIAVIDAETDPFRKGRIPQPFIWGYYDGYQYKTFADARSLARFLRKQKRIVYAHNGGKFDFHYLLGELDPYSDLTIINGRIAKCCIGNAELRDSFCIIPQGLGKYKKDEIDYGLMEPDQRDKPKNREKILDYLRSDCVYLYEMVSVFVDRFGPQLTLAGAAMKQWQKISGDEGIEQCERTDEDFYNALSPYYYGGRVECFKSGIIDCKFDVYDINSAYPYAMLHEHPYSAQYERITGYVKNADFYKLACVSNGALPYRGSGAIDARAFGLSFPSDSESREYTVSAWEYDAATDTKSIRKVKVIESLRFARRVNFAPYINHWWRERVKCKEAQDDLGAMFAKLMLTNLYGKFAANPDNYANYMNVPQDKLHLLLAANGLEAYEKALKSKRIQKLTSGDKFQWTESDRPYKKGWQFGGELGPWYLAERSLEDQAKRYYNVATGASITGFVRAMLWRAIHSSKGVLYCDTDSIAVEQPGGAVRLSSSLGDWKHEGRFDKAGIAGKKLYILRGAPGWWTTKEGGLVYSRSKPKGAEKLCKTASKGVRLSKEQLWRVAAGATVTYETEHPTYSVKSAPKFINRKIRRTAC